MCEPNDLPGETFIAEFDPVNGCTSPDGKLATHTEMLDYSINVETPRLAFTIQGTVGSDPGCAV